MSQFCIVVSNLFSKCIHVSPSGLVKFRISCKPSVIKQCWNIWYYILNQVYFLSETVAVLSLEQHCPVSMISMVNKYDTEVPQVLDSDLTTCLTLDANAGRWMQISLPYIRIKGQFYVSLMGNLKCSPTFGLSVSVVSDCRNGVCNHSRCIASDLITSNGLGGCRYRCHSFSLCNHIAVDIAGSSGITFTGMLCEIGV